MEKIKPILKFWLAAIMIAAVMATVATASASICGELERGVEEYNGMVDKSPLLGWLGSDQRVACTIYLTDAPYNYYNGDGIELIGIETNKTGKVVKIKEGGIGDATIYTTTTDATISGVMQADAPFKEFCTALNNNWIRIEGSGFWSKRKVSAIKMMAKAYGAGKK